MESPHSHTPEPQSLDFEIFFSEKLKARGISLKKLAEESDIALHHLENLLRGNFEQLPPAPYVRGYLITLGRILDFDGEEWWQSLKAQNLIEGAGPRDTLPVNRFAHKPVRKALWGVGIAAFALALYLAVRLPSIMGIPELQITFPQEEQVVTSHQEILFEGRVAPGARLLLNGEEIPVAPDGKWSVEVPLSSGLNVVEFSAKKLLGQERVVRRRVIFQPQASTQDALPIQVIPRGQAPLSQ